MWSSYISRDWLFSYNKFWSLSQLQSHLAEDRRSGINYVPSSTENERLGRGEGPCQSPHGKRNIVGLELTRNPPGRDTGKQAASNYCWALNQCPTEEEQETQFSKWTFLFPLDCPNLPSVSSTFNPPLTAELKTLPLKSPAWFVTPTPFSPRLYITSATGFQPLPGTWLRSLSPSYIPAFVPSHLVPQPPLHSWMALLLLPPEKCKAAGDPLGFLWRAQKMGLNRGVRQQADVLY